MPPLAAPLAVVAVCLAILSIGIFPIRDAGDQWWHLKTGKYLLEAGFDFPEEDVFSWTSKGHQWANHEWLSDTLMYLGYRSLGLRGLIVGKGLLLLVTFALVAWMVRRRTGSWLWALPATLLAAWCSQYSVHLRPPVLTYLMAAIYLHLCLNLLRSQYLLLTHILSFLLVVLWINLHGGGILAPVVTGLILTGLLLSWCAARYLRQESRQRVLKIILIKRFVLQLLIVSLASLVNPFGYEIHLLTLKVMRDAHLVRYVAELQMPNLHHTKGYLVLLLLMITTGLAAVRRVKPWDVLLVLFFTQQSLKHVRHLPLFAIVATPIIFELITMGFKDIRDHITLSRGPLAASRYRHFLSSMLAILALAGSLALLCSRWPVFNKPFFQTKGYIPSGVPGQACDFIIQNPFHGRMYNPINFAGYLIWRLSPKHHQTFTDSRFDIFGSEVMLDCMAIEGGSLLSPDEAASSRPRQESVLGKIETGALEPYWSRALDHYDINFLIILRDNGLYRVLQHQENFGWVQVYLDYDYAIYVRDIPENSQLIQAATSAYEGMMRYKTR
jgi:hypothetical protein